jgi:AcrR family transcriptional regulator
MRERDRKSELVEIAYRLIAQNGLEGFRIRQVATEAGIGNGTLHYHFPSKEALILGVVDYFGLGGQVANELSITFFGEIIHPAGQNKSKQIAIL